MNLPSVLKVILLLALMLLCAGMSWGVVTLALPRAEWVEIGQLTEFPPAKQPYGVYSPVHVFVVNDGDQFLALDPRNQVPRGVNVRWWPDENAFIDPSRGSAFNYLGIPIRRFGSEAPVENQSLPRYEVKIEDGSIFINLKHKDVIELPKN